MHDIFVVIQNDVTKDVVDLYIISSLATACNCVNIRDLCCSTVFNLH